MTSSGVTLVTVSPVTSDVTLTTTAGTEVTSGAVVSRLFDNYALLPKYPINIVTCDIIL